MALQIFEIGAQNCMRKRLLVSLAFYPSAFEISVRGSLAACAMCHVNTHRSIDRFYLYMYGWISEKSSWLPPDIHHSTSTSRFCRLAFFTTAATSTIRFFVGLATAVPDWAHTAVAGWLGVTSSAGWSSTDDCGIDAGKCAQQ